MLVLGIETSCDETGVGLVREGRLLANVVASQVPLHARFGGVVPEIAARAHVEAINPMLAEALAQAGVSWREVEAVAVTVGPGLAGSLLVGLATAKSLALALGVPLVGVNHLEAHVCAVHLEHGEVPPPFLSLVVSGGHTLLLLAEEEGRYTLLGETVDDAAGEAFDKVARFLGLGFPGGPAIDRAAARGDPSAIPFPRSMLQDPSFDFSFAGLKTAVVRHVREATERGAPPRVEDVAASFQEAVVDVQVAKVTRALEAYAVKRLVVAGGVAANSRLRERLASAAAECGVELFVPSPALCTDNGAMVACAGERKLAREGPDPLEVSVDPSLPVGARWSGAGWEPPR